MGSCTSSQEKGRKTKSQKKKEKGKEKPSIKTKSQKKIEKNEKRKGKQSAFADFIELLILGDVKMSSSEQVYWDNAWV